jgi:hypothetical protein
LPACECSKNYRNAFTGEVLDLGKNSTQSRLEVSRVLAEFPLALYMNDASNSGNT